MLNVNLNSAISQNHTVTQPQKQSVLFGVNTVVVNDSFKDLLKKRMEIGLINPKDVKKIQKYIEMLTNGSWLEKLTGDAEKRKDIICLDTHKSLNIIIRSKQGSISNEFFMAVKHNGIVKDGFIEGLEFHPKRIISTYKYLLAKIKAESMVK